MSRFWDKKFSTCVWHVVSTQEVNIGDFFVLVFMLSLYIFSYIYFIALAKRNNSIYHSFIYFSLLSLEIWWFSHFLLSLVETVLGTILSLSTLLPFRLARLTETLRRETSEKKEKSPSPRKQKKEKVNTEREREREREKEDRRCIFDKEDLHRGLERRREQPSFPRGGESSRVRPIWEIGRGWFPAYRLAFLNEY